MEQLHHHENPPNEFALHTITYGTKLDAKTVASTVVYKLAKHRENSIKPWHMWCPVVATFSGTETKARRTVLGSNLHTFRWRCCAFQTAKTRTAKTLRSMWFGSCYGNNLPWCCPKWTFRCSIAYAIPVFGLLPYFCFSVRVRDL
jgi:hypothetical protein